jgi:Family of unknown function (DUF6152)
MNATRLASLKCTLIGLAALEASAPAAAHHSTAFYSTETIELEGELVRVDWQNPHVGFVLRTALPNGGEKLWRMEASAISALQRRGVTRDLFNVGDRVKIAAHPSSRNDAELQVTNVLLPDGREASLWLDSPPRFTRSTINGSEAVVDAARENRGPFRVWSVPRPNPLTLDRISNQPFTAAAVAARASYDLLDNPATRCGPEGMPRVLYGPLPFEFVDRGATILFRTELYDTERTIHMDRTEPPAGEPASILGYSVGRWDGSTLVVTTTRVSWPYFDGMGTAQSEAVEIVERFTPTADQTRLDFHVTVRDPVTLTAPATIEGYWLALGHTVQRFDCQAPQPAAQ